jgi:hypothetical protein
LISGAAMSGPDAIDNSTTASKGLFLRRTFILGRPHGIFFIGY